MAFRRHTLLPLDDCLYALQATIPHLTRSSLHRCLQRHGISRLPDTSDVQPKRFQVQTLSDRAISTSISPKSEHWKANSICSWPSTERPNSPPSSYMNKRPAALQETFSGPLPPLFPTKSRLCSPTMARTSPIRLAMVGRPKTSKRCGLRRCLFACHAFEGACADLDIEHRLTKPRHPWTNGQVERDEPDDQGSDRETLSLRQPRSTSTAPRRLCRSAYNFARRLKTLRGLTPTRPSAKLDRRPV